MKLTRLCSRAPAATLLSARVGQSLCEKFMHAVYDDNNKCDEFCQLYSDGRREAGEEWMTARMGASGENATAAISYEELYNVMTTSPVHVTDTRFTTVMSASTNFYNTVSCLPSRSVVSPPVPSRPVPSHPCSPVLSLLPLESKTH